MVLKLLLTGYCPTSPLPRSPKYTYFYLVITLPSAQPCGHKGAYSIGVWSQLEDIVRVVFPSWQRAENSLGNLGSFLWTVSEGSEFPIAWAQAEN